jgi:hypothetical protein
VGWCPVRLVTISVSFEGDSQFEELSIGMATLMSIRKRNLLVFGLNCMFYIERTLRSLERRCAFLRFLVVPAGG